LLQFCKCSCFDYIVYGAWLIPLSSNLHVTTRLDSNYLYGSIASIAFGISACWPKLKCLLLSYSVVLICRTTVFSHSQTVVVCPGCQTVLCQPTGGKARLTEGCLDPAGA
jgi:hypothetical protein